MKNILIKLLLMFTTSVFADDPNWKIFYDSGNNLDHQSSTYIWQNNSFGNSNKKFYEDDHENNYSFQWKIDDQGKIHARWRDQDGTWH